MRAELPSCVASCALLQGASDQHHSLRRQTSRRGREHPWYHYQQLPTDACRLLAQALHTLKQPHSSKSMAVLWCSQMGRCWGFPCNAQHQPWSVLCHPTLAHELSHLCAVPGAEQELLWILAPARPFRLLVFLRCTLKKPPVTMTSSPVHFDLSLGC